jgi:hypothetical protein
MNEHVRECVRRIHEGSGMSNEQAIDAADASLRSRALASIAHRAAISAAFPFTTPPSGRGEM